MSKLLNLLFTHNKTTITFLLLLSALFSYFAWTMAENHYQAINQAKFERSADESVKRIEAHLLRDGDVLATGVSFIQASDNISAQNWYEFVKGLKIETHYPGMQGFGFSMMIKPHEVASIEQKMRVQGNVSFTLKPSGVREQYSAILYLGPLNERNEKAIGYDMYSNPIRQVAMDMARDSGTPTLSGKVTLVQEIDVHKQAGVLLYTPLYQKNIDINSLQERRKGLIGFVYAPFRMDDLLNNTGAHTDDVNFKIYDGSDLSDENLMYDSSKNAPYTSKYTAVKSLTIYNHTWTIFLSSSHTFDTLNNTTDALWITTGILAVYFILLGIIFNLFKSKYLLQLQTDELNAAQEILRENTQNLIVAKEAAEASERAKSEFLAAMSHEIRTPMNGVLGMLGLLEKSSLEATQRHQVEVATSSATSLLGLINDILDFSKIEAGKMDLELLEFDLKHALEAIVEFTGFKAQEKGLKIILDTDNITYPNIITDPGRLRQILTNLIGNAVKFTNKGQIHINASLHKEDDHHGRLHIDIIDTGIGIPPEKIDTLFEAFTQADGSTTRKYGGSGLGLSIVKKLCELMGGSVSVVSTPGAGSIFSIDLNVSLGSDQIITQAENQTNNDEHIVWPSHTRILLVEDNATNQLVARGILQSIGLDCDIAANGLEAIEAIKISNDTQAYTVVLMDCQMPEMDGYDATRAVRAGKAGEENKHLPIIAMTANAMQGDREKCTDAGMDDYIAKPINLSILQSALVKWILKGTSPSHSNHKQPVAEPTISTDLVLWDEADALKRLGNNGALLNKIIQSFINDGPNSLTALIKALDANNSEEAQLHAHSLKGSSGNIGAIKLQGIAKHLEEAAKNKELSHIREGLDECKSTLYETLKILKEHLAKEIKPAVKKKRLDPLQMAIKLQGLKKELENGMLIETDEVGIFVDYTDEPFTQKMAKLKEHIDALKSAEALMLLETIMAGLE